MVLVLNPLIDLIILNILSMMEITVFGNINHKQRQC